ncbi:hypothetical protein VOLCADRAFT_108793, partial [Volvox carteri f. nagariensis]
MMACKQEAQRLTQQGGFVTRPIPPPGVRDVSCAWPPDMRMHLYGMSDEAAEEEYQRLYSQFQHRCTRRREPQPNALDSGRRVSPRTSPSPAPGARTVGPNMDPEAQHIVSPDTGPRTGYIQGQRATNPNVGHRIGGAGITGLPPRGPPSRALPTQLQHRQDDAARGRMPSGGVWDLGEIDTTGGQGPVASWKCRRCQNRHSIIRCCACGSFARPQLTEGGGKRYTCEQCDNYDFGLILPSAGLAFYGYGLAFYGLPARTPVQAAAAAQVQEMLRAARDNQVPALQAELSSLQTRRGVKKLRRMLKNDKNDGRTWRRRVCILKHSYTGIKRFY